MTPHNKAKKGEIAKTVLMPGDPLRAKWVAENFLTKVKLVNDVRNMLAYTGEYKGIKVTVMGHGMGIPSIGIYSYELFAKKFYDVDNIIRIGSAGTINPKLNLGDVVIINEAYGTSHYPEEIGVKIDSEKRTLKPSTKLFKLANELAKTNKFNLIKAKANSSDTFYSIIPFEEHFKKNKIDVYEMESLGLFANAIKHKKHALCLLTISDSLITKQEMPAVERQTGFKNMVNFALKLVKNIK